MRNIYTKIILLIGVSIVLQSCFQDTVDQFTPIEEKWNSLDEFYENTENARKVKVNHVEEDFVIEADGVIYKFRQNSLTNPITPSATEGPAEFRYRHIHNAGEFILNNIFSTGTQGDILYPKHVVHFEMYQNGNKLSLDSSKPVEIYIPSDDVIIDTENSFEWVDNGFAKGFTQSNLIPELQSWDFEFNGKQYQGTGYKLKMQRQGWYAMGEFEHELYQNTNDYGSIKINVPQEFKNSETRVYVTHEDRKVAIPIDLNNGVYSHGAIKKGELIHIVAVSVKDEKIQFGKKSIIVDITNEYDINLDPISFIEFIAELESL